MTSARPHDAALSQLLQGLTALVGELELAGRPGELDIATPNGDLDAGGPLADTPVVVLADLVGAVHQVNSSISCDLHGVGRDDPTLGIKDSEEAAHGRRDLAVLVVERGVRHTYSLRREILPTGVNSKCIISYK